MKKAISYEWLKSDDIMNKIAIAWQCENSHLSESTQSEILSEWRKGSISLLIDMKILHEIR